MIGRRIAHYEIGERLGKGGVGEVYRAPDGRSVVCTRDTDSGDLFVLDAVE